MLILRPTCFSGMHLQGAGGRAGVSGPVLHYVVLSCPLKAFMADGWDEYGHALLSSPRMKDCIPTFREPSQKSNQSSSCIPQCPSEPCIHPARV